MEDDGEGERKGRGRPDASEGVQRTGADGCAGFASNGWDRCACGVERQRERRERVTGVPVTLTVSAKLRL